VTVTQAVTHVETFTVPTTVFVTEFQTATQTDVQIPQKLKFSLRSGCNPLPKSGYQRKSSIAQVSLNILSLPPKLPP
jgi:hypothetical protein